MAVVFYDNFTGTTIDTNKWTETDPNSFISQNDAIIFALPHTADRARFNNRLVSSSSVASGVAVAQANITWTTDGNGEAVGGLFLWKDNDNYAYIGSRSTGGTFKLEIWSAGTRVYNLESSTAKNKDVKIWTDGTTIKFYYWGGASWTQLGTTQTYSLGYGLKYVLSCQDYNGANGANPVTIDNAYFCDADYSTQTPLSQYSFQASVGAFTLTGVNINIIRTYLMSLSSGAFAVTGFDVNMMRTFCYRMAVNVANFALSVFDVNIFGRGSWTWKTDSKPSASSYSNDTKPTNSFNNDTKPTSSWTNDSL